jgi:hypothetical protein
MVGDCHGVDGWLRDEGLVLLHRRHQELISDGLMNNVLLHLICVCCVESDVAHVTHINLLGRGVCRSTVKTLSVWNVHLGREIKG